MNINNSSKLSPFSEPLNKFPKTGTFPRPGICPFLLNTLFFLIPPITTMSPSAIKSLVLICIVLIDGSAPEALFTESLLTETSKSTFPSPIMLGVTSNSKTAGLKPSLYYLKIVYWLLFICITVLFVYKRQYKEKKY